MNLQREQMLKNIIRQRNLGALVFWRPDELVITCGYFPLWGLSLLVYTDDDAPVLFVPELEPEDNLPKHIKVEKFPWGVMDCTDPWGILINMIKGRLVEKKIQHLPVAFIKSIGGTAPCMMSGEQPPLPPDLVDRLSTLTEGGFKDVTQDLVNLYAYKTDADVRCLRRTHKITAFAVATFYENLKPGITEAELAGKIEYAVQRMTGSEGVYFSKAWPMVMSGRNAMAGGKYNRSTGKKLQSGEMVMLEMAICVNGYWADITRTGQTSELSVLQSKVFNTVLESLTTGGPDLAPCCLSSFA